MDGTPVSVKYCTNDRWVRKRKTNGKKLNMKTDENGKDNRTSDKGTFSEKLKC